MADIGRRDAGPGIHGCAFGQSITRWLGHGLSVSFCRDNLTIIGVPHHYLTQKQSTPKSGSDGSLVVEMLATGFSESHLARHFRHMLGTTPREFRWSQR
jgi:hypothetical protein